MACYLYNERTEHEEHICRNCVYQADDHDIVGTPCYFCYRGGKGINVCMFKAKVR